MMKTKRNNLEKDDRFNDENKKKNRIKRRR